jgi:hypothetical protein
MSAEDARKKAIYQLLQRLQQFAQAMRFGVDRFIVPLADRKDLLSSPDHFCLFQNSEEVHTINIFLEKKTAHKLKFVAGYAR